MHQPVPINCRAGTEATNRGIVAVVLEAGGPRGHVHPRIFWREGTGGHHAVRKCTMKFAVLSK